MQPTRPISAVYTQSSGIKATLVAYAIVEGHSQPSSIRPEHAI